jgi:hypothetical protein
MLIAKLMKELIEKFHRTLRKFIYVTSSLKSVFGFPTKKKPRYIKWSLGANSRITGTTGIVRIKQYVNCRAYIVCIQGLQTLSAQSI